MYGGSARRFPKCGVIRLRLQISVARFDEYGSQIFTMKSAGAKPVEEERVDGNQ